METNKKNFTEQDIENANEFYLALRNVVNNNKFKMKLKVLTFSLACFLVDISDIPAQYGINKDDYIDQLAETAKAINTSEDLQTDK